MQLLFVMLIMLINQCKLWLIIRFGRMPRCFVFSCGAAAAKLVGEHERHERARSHHQHANSRSEAVCHNSRLITFVILISGLISSSANEPAGHNSSGWRMSLLSPKLTEFIQFFRKHVQCVASVRQYANHTTQPTQLFCTAPLLCANFSRATPSAIHIQMHTAAAVKC